jgi:hypothetical protein
MAVPLNTAVAAIPVLIYSPSPSGIPHVVITNCGLYTVYIGGASVSAASGIPLAPKGQISLPYAPLSLYAVSGFTATATATTTTANVTAGTGTVAVTAGTGLSNTLYIELASGTAAEVVQVSSGGGTTTLTTTKPLYDHLSGVAVTLVTAQASAVMVSAGAS